MRDDSCPLLNERSITLRAALTRLFNVVDWIASDEDILPPSLDDLDSEIKLAEAIEQSCELLGSNIKSLEERFELLSNNIAAAIMIEDESGNMVYCSPFSEVLTGYALEELPQKSLDVFSKLVVPEDLEKLLRGREVSRLGEDIKLEYRIRHSTGMRFWWESHVVPIYDHDGSVQGLMWVSYDVSHYVYSRQALQDRNQDISDFTYMVSHDLKAPVYTIAGMADALKSDFGSKIGDDGISIVDFISKAAKQMELLIASVVEYSNVSVPKGMDEEIHINELMEDVTRDLSGLIKYRNAHIHIGEVLPVVLGERLRVYQIFSNLIGNAIKYSAKTREPEIKVHCISQPDWNIVVVEDNGIGIPKSSFDKIFRPFQRVHSNLTEGSGIGLACVTKIVKQLGGTISVESEVDVGSKFSIYFPTTTRRRQELAHNATKYDHG